MADKVALMIDVTVEERQQIEELARQHGFDTPGQYLLSLVKSDIQDEDTHETIVESFGQGWREAMSGQTIPASRLWDALQDDE